MKTSKILISIISLWVQSALAAQTPYSAEGTERYQQLMQKINRGAVQNYAEYFYTGVYSDHKTQCLLTVDAGPEDIYFFIKPVGHVDLSWSRNLGIPYPVNTKAEIEKDPALIESTNGLTLNFTTLMPRKGQSTLIEKNQILVESKSPNIDDLKRVLLSKNSPMNDKSHNNSVLVTHDCSALRFVLKLDWDLYQKMIDAALSQYNKQQYKEEPREAQLDDKFECDMLAADKLTCDIRLVTDYDEGGGDVLHVDYRIQSGAMPEIIDIDFEASH